MAADTDSTFCKCSKCGEKKPATFEYFDNYKDRGKVRQRAFCRVCLNARTRAYRAANPDKVQEWERRNYDTNKHAGSDYHKRRYARLDKDKAREDLKRWKSENPDKVRAAEVSRNKHIKARRLVDPDFRESLNKKSREWMRQKRHGDLEFREKKNALTRDWHRRNKEKLRAYYRARAAARRSNDVEFRIKESVRSRLRSSLKGEKKSASLSDLLGAPMDVVKSHIESQFKDGMNWENWGRGWYGKREWHLDHIKPLASFDLSDPAQLAASCHYTNLQPLWAAENLKKGGG